MKIMPEKESTISLRIKAFVLHFVLKEETDILRFFLPIKTHEDLKILIGY